MDFSSNPTETIPPKRNGSVKNLNGSLYRIILKASLKINPMWIFEFEFFGSFIES